MCDMVLPGHQPSCDTVLTLVTGICGTRDTGTRCGHVTSALGDYHNTALFYDASTSLYKSIETKTRPIAISFKLNYHAQSSECGYKEGTNKGQRTIMCVLWCILNIWSCLE